VTLAAMFISYDGLLDPLGGSQILPYLYGIAAHPRPVHILSFEKPDRFAAGGAAMRAELDRHGITWTPLSFTKGGGKLGKLWDLSRMYATALALHLRRRFGIVHCRGYPAMQVGCLLHRLTGVKTLFDMRGLWVDERVDGGLWNRENWRDRLLYRAYKRVERHLLRCATYIISLTERVLPELQRLAPNMTAPVTVIPCCADFEHFNLPPPGARDAIRDELGVPPDARLIAYLGSLGTWYMLDEMFRFFASAAQRWGNVHMLIVTRDWKPEHEAMFSAMGLDALRDLVHVRPASRDELPGILGAADVMLSFIKPAYSKMASSPTKLAEAFAIGIPTISNAGVGDVDEMTRVLDAGATIDLSDPEAMEGVVGQLDVICRKRGSALRERARKMLGLEVAEQAYREVYHRLERANGAPVHGSSPVRQL